MDIINNAFTKSKQRPEQPDVSQGASAVMKQLMKRIGTLRSDPDMREVAKGSSVALIVRVAGAFLGLAVSMAIARTLGAEGSGIYYLTTGMIAIASTFGRVGFDYTVVRFVASHASAGEWAAVRKVNAATVLIVSGVSFVIAVVLVIGAPFLAAAVFKKSSMEIPIVLTAVSVVPFSIAIVHAEALRGLKQIRDSQLIKNVILSLGTLVLLYPFSLFLGTRSAIYAYTGAVIITSLVSWVLWRRGFNHAVHDQPLNNKTTTKIATLFDSSFPLFGVALSGLIFQQGATIFLGRWGSIGDVGIFNTASRVTSLLLFPLMAMISVLTPKFAALHRQSDIDGLSRLARNSSWVLTIVAVPMAIAVFMSAEWILAIFGQQFVAGAPILRILLIGVVINVTTGAQGELLIMSGYGQMTNRINIIGAVVVIVLSVTLIPIYGMTGAAIAVTSGYSIINLIMVIMVKRCLGFWPVGLN